MAESPPAGDGGAYWQRLRSQKREILSVRAATARERGRLESTLTAVARALAHPGFFALEIAFHLGWVWVNTGQPGGLAAWDPYPFPLLTGLASVQALFIALLILMYQERDARVGELRDETNLQVALHSERETTRLLRMMMQVQARLGIAGDGADAELHEMAQPLDPQKLKESLEERLGEANEAG